MSKKILSVGGALALALALAACGSKSSSSSNAGGLNGAGSTLVAPLMAKWQSDYPTKGGTTITYGAIGSGGGIDQITSRTVDFGASDAPLSSDQFKAANGVEQIPWALSGTVPAYNLPGVSNLKLSGPVLADIYLGTIKTWNDPAIAQLNPGAKLPSTKITPVYRSDGSGDTYAFTNYLSTVSSTFKSKVGTSTQVQWPTGSGGNGNDGVSAVIGQTPGAIGYVSFAYATKNNLTVASVQNAAGKPVKPSVASFQAAAAAVKTIKSDNSISLAQLPSSASAAYPISTYTYVIVPLKSSKAQALKQFITYAITPAAQQFGADLGFAKLPPQVLSADKKAIQKIQSG